MDSTPNIEHFNLNLDGFTPEAETAFLFAIDILDNLLDPDFITQPINVDASFTDLTEIGLEETVLGKGQPTIVIGDISPFISDPEFAESFLPNVL